MGYMIPVGRLVTIAGVVLILLPIVAFGLSLLGREFSTPLTFAPTFILGGIVVFVIGIAIQTLTGR